MFDYAHVDHCDRAYVGDYTAARKRSSLLAIIITLLLATASYCYPGITLLLPAASNCSPGITLLLAAASNCSPGITLLLPYCDCSLLLPLARGNPDLLMV